MLASKRAQYSRVDYLVLYGLCIFVVVLAVGTLYSLDMIGEYKLGGKITGAVVIEDTQEKTPAPEVSTVSDNQSLPVGKV
jgi:hypothetical protein